MRGLMLSTLIWLASLVSLSLAQPAPLYIRHSFYSNATQLLGRTFAVSVATVGNTVVCGLNFQSFSLILRPFVNGVEAAVIPFKGYGPFVSRYTHLMFSFSAASLSNAILFQGVVGIARASMHCAELSGVTGIDSYSTFDGLMPSTSTVIATRTLCPNVTFVTSAVAYSGVPPNSMSGVLVSSPLFEANGMSYSRRSDLAVMTSTLHLAQWAALQSSYLSIMAIAFASCGSTASSCSGPSCRCGALFCESTASVVVPPGDTLRVSPTNNLVISSPASASSASVSLNSSSVLVADFTTGYDRAHGMIDGAVDGNGGNLTLLVSPVPLARTVLIATAYRSNFSSIELVSSDPCQIASGSVVTPSLALSVIFSFTRSSSPACSSCATMSPPCQRGTCADTMTGPTCQCPNVNGFGFSGTLCDALVCPSNCGGASRGTCTLSPPTASYPICVCTGQWSGPECSAPVCNPTCQNGASCTSGGVCNCVGAWQGPACDVPIIANTCPSSCGPGNCSAATNYTCSCPPVGYSGTQCQIVTCAAACVNGLCQGDSVGSVPRCNCSSASWSGSTCDTRVCQSGDCLNGGTCLATGATVSCSCPPQWGGSSCQLQRTSAPPAGLPVGAIVGIACGVAALAIVAGIIGWRLRTRFMQAEQARVQKALEGSNMRDLRK